MYSCQPLPLHHLQMMSSLRTLWMSCSSSNGFSFDVGDSNVRYQFPIESMLIQRCNASGKELMQLLTCFPKLSDLELWKCDRITGRGVLGQDIRAEEGIAASKTEDGLFLLPPELQELWIWFCLGLRLLSNPCSNSKEDGRTRRGGLQCLTSLWRLNVVKCPKLLSSYSSPSFMSYFPFPSSLENLSIKGAVGMGRLSRYLKGK